MNIQNFADTRRPVHWKYKSRHSSRGGEVDPQEDGQGERAGQVHGNNGDSQDRLDGDELRGSQVRTPAQGDCLASGKASETRARLVHNA